MESLIKPISGSETGSDTKPMAEGIQGDGSHDLSPLDLSDLTLIPLTLISPRWDTNPVPHYPTRKRCVTSN